MLKRRFVVMILLLTICTSLVACGNSTVTSSNTSQTEGTIDQPVTLTFWSGSATPEDQFNSRFGDPLQKKFPNLTIKYIKKGTGTNLSDLLAAGTPLDIYFESIGGFAADVQQAGFQYDMTDLMKKDKVDTSRFESSSIDYIHKLSNGGIWGLPVWIDDLVLFYNKDLFDKFGVSYPMNGMTWDQVLDIAKQMTRNDNGTQYIGLSYYMNHMLYMNQFSLPFIDPQTGKADINVDPRWKEFYQTFLTPFDDPAYKGIVKQLKDTPYKNNLLGTKNLAMLVAISNTIFPPAAVDMNSTNWDMASLPTFKELPGLGSQAYPTYFGITSNSPNKEAAMEAIKYLTSDQYQEDMAKLGIMPAINNEAIKKELGANSPYPGKNFGAIYYNKFAPQAPRSIYDSVAQTPYSKMFPQMATGDIDLNSAMLSIEDQANKAIDAAKQQR
ncbi:MAG: extracellular solute-binding protein family 1 [Bacilli bacterium]|nr:extracellular solute-binding protein family 1 [Bacilli bacterium]